LYVDIVNAREKRMFIVSLLVESWKIFCSFIQPLKQVSSSVSFGSMPLDSGGLIILDVPYSLGYHFFVNYFYQFETDSLYLS